MKLSFETTLFLFSLKIFNFLNCAAYGDFSCFVRIRALSSAIQDGHLFINDNPLCSINRNFVGRWQEISFDCNGTTVIHANSQITTDSTFRIQCLSSFPLDIDVGQNIPFDKFVTYAGETNSRSIFANVEQGSTEKYYFRYGTGDELVTRNLWDRSFSSNYTFYSTLDSKLNITIDLRFAQVPENVPSSEADKMKNSGIEIQIYDNVVRCGRSTINDMDVFSITGTNPTHTRLLRSCFVKGKNQCPGLTVHRGISCSNSGLNPVCTFAPSNLSQGILFCASGNQEESMGFFISVNGYSALKNIPFMWEDKNVIRILEEDGLDHYEVHKDKLDQPPAEVLKFYETEDYGFECHFLPYFLITPIVWSVEFANKTHVLLFKDNDEPKGSITEELKRSVVVVTNIGRWNQERVTSIRSSHVKIRGVMGMIAVKCTADYWNYARNATATYNVTIKSLSESIPPSFQEQESTHSANLGSPLKLNCSADLGDPEPTYSWKVLTPKVGLVKFHSEKSLMLNLTDSDKSYYVVNETIQNNRTVSVLTVDTVSADMGGDYICVAKNIRDEAKHRFKVGVHLGVSLWISMGIPFSIIMLLGLILGALMRKLYLQRGHLNAMEIKLFEKGNKSELQENKFAHENAQFMPYNRAYEIKWEDFQIYDDTKLGEGAYGVVFKGSLMGSPSRTVAIKTVKPGVDKSVLLALLSELKVMIHLETNENIVALIGACTEFLRDGQVYILVEYCHMGSLESYLRKTDKNAFESVYLESNPLPAPQDTEYVYEASELLRTRDMINWAMQIASGMQYLQGKKVIHGDLAARNILLYSKAQVKITDFGLSRQLLNYDHYIRKSQNKLPWRWLALETLKSNVFSYKSDVWSLGVTLWEIFTLGLVPYPGMRWTPEFVSLLEQNLRLSQPKFANEEIYRIMARCWDAEPQKRPEFQEIEELFRNMIS